MAVLIRSSWAATTLAMAIVTGACGGSEDVNAADSSADASTGASTGAPVAAPPGTAPIAAPVTAPPDPAAPRDQPEARHCLRIPAPDSAGTTRSVGEFGAIADDGRDDADAIQRALDSLQAGQTLWFTSGRYQIGRSLRVRRAGLTLSGSNAVIHATNVDDQSLLIEADNTTVASLTFTAVTQGRRSAPRHSRIAVIAAQPDGTYRSVRNTVIRDNRIVNAGAAGTAEANSASSAGIMLFHADGFLVADNTVVRTLADGIHITAGSRNGRVLNNTLRETGDDMIAVVSYAESGSAVQNSAARLLQSWDSRVEQRLVRNILIAGNEGSGQYWGRGISVVGGQSVTISGNTLDNVPVAAAILVAREANYQTFGAQNVVIEGNTLREVQTLAPPYDPTGRTSARARTGHAAIEIQSAQFEDEAADSTLRSALAVRNVLVRGNTVDHSNSSALRAGVNMSRTLSVTDAAGLVLTRNVRQGLIEGLSVQRNRFTRSGGEPMSIQGSGVAGAGMHCSDNQVDGRNYSTGACRAAAAPVVSGAVMRCSADGRVR